MDQARFGLLSGHILVMMHVLKVFQNLQRLVQGYARINCLRESAECRVQRERARILELALPCLVNSEFGQGLHNYGYLICTPKVN